MAKVINLDTVVMSGATDNVVQVSEAKNERINVHHREKRHNDDRT